MSSLLINEILFRLPLTDTVLDSFLWSNDKCPDLDRIEAVHFLIDALRVRCTSEDRERLSERVTVLIWEKCVPLLKQIQAERSLRNFSDTKTLHALCSLLNSCLGVVPGEAEKLTSIALPALQNLNGEDGFHNEGYLDFDVTVEVLAVLIPFLTKKEEVIVQLTTCILTAAKVLPDELVSKILVRVLFTLLNSVDDRIRDDILLRVWQEVCCWHSSKSKGDTTARSLLCLTAVSDYLFPPGKDASRRTSHADSSSDPRRSSAFWSVVHSGLTQKDNVARKRALYLLKKCIALSELENTELQSVASVDDELCLFRWVPNETQILQRFWQDYVLVMETLEENQIHVVRPVINRISALIETTASEKEGAALIHPCWLLCLYQRMFDSENKAVMREGVCHLLDLEMRKSPTLALALSQFIVGHFMDVLSESALYHRSPNQVIGECPEMALKLQTFLVNFFDSLPEAEKGPILLKLIQRLSSRHWCAVPLLFLSQALARLTPLPVLGPAGLLALREVLRCTMTTHQVLLRGAAQCFLLQCTLRLTYVQAVTLEEMMSFLAHFRSDESLCRGTALWTKVCNWLADNEAKFLPSTCVPQEAELKDGGLALVNPFQSHVQQRLDAFLTVPASTEEREVLPDGGDADLLALSLVLCSDTEELRKGGGERRERGGGGEGEGGGAESVEFLLRPLVDVLCRLSTSLYLPQRKSDKCLQLLLRLMQLTKTHELDCANSNNGDVVAEAVASTILSVVEPVQNFISRRLAGELQEMCDIERAGLYLSVLKELMQRYAAVPWYRGNLQHNLLPSLSSATFRTLQQPTGEMTVHVQVGRAVAMATLAALCEVSATRVCDDRVCLQSIRDHFSLPEHLNQALLKPIVTADAESDSPWLRDWGRVAAQFIHDQWICHRALLQLPQYQARPLGGASFGDSLKAALEALTLLPYDLVFPVLDAIAFLLPQVVLSDEALCVEAVVRSWKVVQGLSSNANDFWPALKAFVRLAFHKSLLELTSDQAPDLTTTLKQIGSELLALSEVKSGVFNALISHCCQTWLTSDPGSESEGINTWLSSVLTHQELLMEACLHGPVFRRDQRLIQEVQVYVEQLGEQFAANVAIASDQRDEQFPRVCVLAFLSRLRTSCPAHQTVMEQLLLRLLEKDKGIAKSKVRYYSNSLQHRLRNRVWQTVLLLLPKLRQEFVVGPVLSYALEAVLSSNQASVKYLIEWVLLLLLYHNPSYMERFWEAFNVDHEKTKTSVCTLLSVLVHMHILLPRFNDQVGQWRKALEVILQWCFSHNFSVRLYALLALKCVWGLKAALPAQEGDQAGVDGLGGLATVIQACLNQAETTQSTGNALKNWCRIQEHFLFSIFHPLRDYSVETIFYSFPRLSELADDEWIPPWKFERLVAFPVDSSLPVRNTSQELSLLQPCDWIQQDKGDLEQEERWVDVQKKITAWRLSFQEQEPALAAQQRALRLGKLTSALLVVASLIDKPTNLGGLCRTCEIFGASGLALDNLRHVSDKQFQALSVSSELWLPLLEVKPADLSTFLLDKKAEGYCIVGVEQTANSKGLQEFRFPKKSLLLLGNEREGIPANLLQLLDVCVEIPQQGVTRSLNVHVSAALLVWEYTRQHLHPSPSTSTSQEPPPSSSNSVKSSPFHLPHQVMDPDLPQAP